MSVYSKIGYMTPCARLIIAILDCGLDGKHGTVAIHASSKGLRITINGHKLASGKTPKEFYEAYNAEVEAAKKEVRRG